MDKAKEREKMIGLIINAKRTDPETGSFTEWLAACVDGWRKAQPWHFAVVRHGGRRSV